MNIMKSILVVLVCVFFASCSTEAPKDDEVKQVVKDWYLQQDAIRNQGHTEISGITVLSIERDTAHKKLFNTKCLVTGTYTAGTLESVNTRTVNDTVFTKLEWNGAKWVTAE